MARIIGKKGESFFFGDMVIGNCLCCSRFSKTMYISAAPDRLSELLEKNGHELGGRCGARDAGQNQWEIEEYDINVLYTHMKFANTNIKPLHNKNRDRRDS